MKLIYQLALYFITNDSQQLILTQFCSTDKKFLLFNYYSHFIGLSSIIS